MASTSVGPEAGPKLLLTDAPRTGDGSSYHLSQDWFEAAFSDPRSQIEPPHRCPDAMGRLMFSSGTTGRRRGPCYERARSPWQRSPSGSASAGRLSTSTSQLPGRAEVKPDAYPRGTSLAFERAKGMGETIAIDRKGRLVCDLGDGRWWDEERSAWRDGRGRLVRAPCPC